MRSLLLNLGSRHVTHPSATDPQFIQRTLERWVHDLDPRREYLLKSEVEYLAAEGSQFFPSILKHDFDREEATIYLLRERVAERLPLLEQWATADYSYAENEFYELNTESVAPPSTLFEAEDRSRRRVKFLRLRLALYQPELSIEEQKQQALEIVRREANTFLEAGNDDLAETLVNSVAHAADPHTTYFAPDRAAQFAAAMQLKIAGIGVELGLRGSQLHIGKIFPGGPAAGGNVRSGDVIVEVDSAGDGSSWESAEKLGLGAAKKIRGPVGTKVGLRLRRNGEPNPIEVVLVRGEIRLENGRAKGKVLNLPAEKEWPAARVGVIHLPGFYNDHGEDGKGISASEDVRNILMSAEFKDVDLVLLDLRGNGGGALSDAVDLVGHFIDKGPVVLTTNGVMGHILEDGNEGRIYGGPLMVAIDGGSASASEIVAAALQDYGRAAIIGSASHGKGTVQVVTSLASKGSKMDPSKGILKVTTEVFYRVTGLSTQGPGVQPDVYFPSLVTASSEREEELPNVIEVPVIDSLEIPNERRVTPEMLERLAARARSRMAADARFRQLEAAVDSINSERHHPMVPLEKSAAEARKALQNPGKGGADEIPLVETELGNPEHFYNEAILQAGRDLLLEAATRK